VSGREKQIERDRYYMRIAQAVQEGADCLGSKVGAVLVLENRVIGTGYNGTPSGFPNCTENGCVRCRDSKLAREGRVDQMSDPDHRSGRALDRCICVHAEQNALITAARFGIRVDAAVLYTTLSPCFGCLKEAVQAGISRVVYRSWYEAKYSDALQRQYEQLAAHLSDGDEFNFEPLGGVVGVVDAIGQPDPYSDDYSGAQTFDQINDYLRRSKARRPTHK
jgi:dCMP deaminase